jgi:adenine/guanine phosphoribosyltransferase-like PRPP-binding protein
MKNPSCAPSCAPYFQTGITQWSKTLRELTKLIKSHPEIKFDSIVGTGVSGMLFLPALSNRLKVPFAIVRKDDSSHSSREVEFSSSKLVLDYIIIDDLIDSGDTVRNIQEKMSEFCLSSKARAVFLYEPERDAGCYFGDDLPIFKL